MKGVKDITRRVKAIMCRVINNYIIVLQEINSCYGYFKKISGFSITNYKLSRKCSARQICSTTNFNNEECNWINKGCVVVPASPDTVSFP